MLSKDKLVEAIDRLVESQREYETEGDGLSSYNCIFTDSHLQPDIRLTVCRAIALLELPNDYYKTTMDIVHDCKETDQPAELIDYIIENLFWCTETVYSPGIFVTHEDQCLNIDSAACGEMEIQVKDNIDGKKYPLFREYYNRHGDAYMSDDCQYVYQDIDGHVCYRFVLDDLRTVYDDRLIELLEKQLPHGSGIDCDWEIEEKNGKLHCKNSFHCLNNAGYYDDYADFTIILEPASPLDFKLQFNGQTAQYKNRRYLLREYLEDTLHCGLSEIFKNV